MMEAVWASNGPVTARDVEEVSGTEAKYITVLTVLNNLSKKGLLHRERRGRVMVFEATMSREALLSSVSLDVIRGLIDLSPRIAVNSFVGTLEELDPETLEELRRELATHLARRDEENDS